MIFSPALPLYILIPLLALTLAAVIYSFAKASKQGRRQMLRAVTRTVGVLLLCLAVIRPAIPTVAEIERLGTNLDIYFVLDTTASMGVEDIQSEAGTISRLDVAKQKISDLAEENVGAKYSLLTFDSTTPKVEIPLVSDLSALNGTLEVLTPRLYGPPTPHGTNTMMVAGELQKILVKASENNPERVRVLYYITDGEDADPDPNFDPDLSLAAEIADEKYVIGVGTEEGGDIPLYTFDQGLNIIQDGTYGAISTLVPAQIDFIADQLGASASFIDSTATNLPPVTSQTVEEKLRLIDKSSPAQFEFYWVLVILGGILLILDVNNLGSQTYRLIRRRTY